MKRIIKILEYQNTWAEEFEHEKTKIVKILEKEKIKIHHIGSTSIPEMIAKPTIDIMIEIDNVNKIDTYNKQFKDIGYISMGEYGIKGRRYFYKEENFIHTHHIHVFQENSYDVKRHFAFKMLLTENAEIRKKYCELKIKAARKYAEYPDKYCKYKNKFIKGNEKIAMILYFK